MRNLFNRRTSLGERFVLGIAFALVPILVLCCWLLAHQWLAYRSASEAVRGFNTFRATLLAMEVVSAERGPTNGVLGEEVPIPPARLAALALARQRSDTQVAALLSNLRLDHSPARVENVEVVAKLGADLASARTNVDELVAQPLSWRGDQTTQNAVNRMIALISELLPVVIVEMSVVNKGDPDVAETMLVAKLAADLREQAGQLGSRFTSALAMHRSLTNDEQLAIARTNGRIDQLRALIDLRMLDHPALTAEALATMTWRYFGDGQRYVAQIHELASRPGGADVSTGAFAEHYVPTMRSITQLRDVLLAEAEDKLQQHRRTALIELAIATAAVAWLLCTLAWITLMFRRDIVRPFAHATHVIQAIAKGELSIHIPSSSRHAEIRELFDAARVLRQNSIERGQLETERGQLICELATSAYPDALTRAPNRRAFENEAHALLERPDTQASPIALIRFDVDHLKHMNNTYGHSTGDEALRLIAALCHSTWQKSDVVARIGRDEFAVLATVENAQQAVSLAERTRQRIAESVVKTDSGAGCRMTVNFGIAFAPPHGERDIDVLLERAGRMLTEAKLSGYDSVVVDWKPLE